MLSASSAGLVNESCQTVVVRTERVPLNVLQLGVVRATLLFSASVAFIGCLIVTSQVRCNTLLVWIRAGGLASGQNKEAVPYLETRVKTPLSAHPVLQQVNKRLNWLEVFVASRPSFNLKEFKPKEIPRSLKKDLGFTANQLLFELKSKTTTGDASLLPLFAIVMIRKSIQEDN
jgi:hypothetical protein